MKDSITLASQSQRDARPGLLTSLQISLCALLRGPGGNTEQNTIIVFL